ncbi:MAG: hypothetical protein BWX80_03111 [Candidatus Hydrogenedentes bacterium ADurb.Bin101]|nr:MAG: hypothetical protein BWX80_03111 [Candidatus Hydrogenedentes bacterium ADurb.Bin101]
MHIGTARVHAYLAHDGHGSVAHPLVFPVGKSLGRRHRDAVSGVHTHGIQVFNGTDDNHIIVEITHDLQFIFFPANHGFFNEDFRYGAGVQSVFDGMEVFVFIEGKARAGTAQGKGRAYHRGISDLFSKGMGLFDGMNHLAAGHVQADPFHGFLEQAPVFRFFYGAQFRADEFAAVFMQDALFCKGDGQVQPGLAAYCGQKCIGAFPLDDTFQKGHGKRFNIYPLRSFRVGHDRGRIAVDQDHRIAFFPQGLAGLGAAVVKFAGLADNDRPASNKHDFPEVSSFGHNGYRLGCRKYARRATIREQVALIRSVPACLHVLTVKSTP